MVRKPAAVALNRSQVRRLRLFDLEHVVHRTDGQEWVPHWHDEWSFGAIVDGTCRCSVAGRHVVPSAGDLVAIAPGVVHTGALSAGPGGRQVQVVMLYVPTDWLLHAGLGVPRCSGVAHAPSLARAARRLHSAADAQAWLRRAVPAMAEALLGHADASDDPMPSAAVRRLLQRVQQGVQSGEQSVGGLAHRCAVSRERMHRVIKRWLGMAPVDYLRAVRLHRARHLLLGGQPAAAVAAECGFADQAHFTRWFRRSFGYTPGDLAHASRRPADG